MENQNQTPLTLEEAKKMENYDFSHEGVVYYKGEKMTKAQVGKHIEILRGARIRTEEFMWIPLQKMLKNAVLHPTPWRKIHVYG